MPTYIWIFMMNEMVVIIKKQDTQWKEGLHYYRAMIRVRAWPMLIKTSKH